MTSSRRFSHSRTTPWLGLLSVLCAAFVSPRPAAAAEPAVPDPAALALFESARELVEKGDWAAGCAKFEASLMVYAAPSTMLNLARCYEHEGKLAKAWSAYKRALVLNQETPGAERKTALETIAKEGITQIEPKLPRVKLTVTDAPVGLYITRNGQEVPRAMLGSVIPVDPGPQTIAVQAPGHRAFRKSFTATEGKTEDVVITLVPEGDADALGGGRIPAWAWVAAGGSVALGVTAAAFRIDQAYIEGRQEALCKGDLARGCPPRSEYDPTDDNAHKRRNFGLFVGFGAGSVLALGAAVTGFVIGAKTPARGTAKGPVVVPLLGPNVAGAAIGGRF
ncbi:hypothetical protein [Polyangium spumosum]|uniref:Uncharacterized protein n=1 Tax=Polyangium spumosum TaxID=889282 RepID=A0A6N7PW57_9BACT|nr:hypothetical protein [Polyangium spumosum]MRG96462.1 hypothetical protein [Polyangium spumosum]